MSIYPKKSKRPLRSIRNFCSECSRSERRSREGERSIEDVSKCTENCPLYDFRLGKNPFLKGRTKGNPETSEQWQLPLEFPSESTKMG